MENRLHLILNKGIEDLHSSFEQSLDLELENKSPLDEEVQALHAKLARLEAIISKKSIPSQKLSNSHSASRKSSIDRRSKVLKEVQAQEKKIATLEQSIGNNRIKTKTDDKFRKLQKDYEELSAKFERSEEIRKRQKAEIERLKTQISAKGKSKVVKKRKLSLKKGVKNLD